MANSLRFEVPFPAAGEGIVLRYTLNDLGVLRGKYGDPAIKMPEVDELTGRVKHLWRDNLFQRLGHNDPVVIVDCINAGAKRTGESRAFKVDIDALDASTSELIPLIEDALCLALFGLTARELAEQMRATADEIAKARAEAAAEGDPLDPTIGTAPETT